MTLAETALAELAGADDVLSHSSHSKYLTGSHLTVARIRLHHARLLWLRLGTNEDVKGQLPAVQALVEAHLDKEDARRAEVVRIAQSREVRNEQQKELII